MRHFNITVNGMSYQVSVEEVGAANTAAPAPVAIPVAPAPVAAPVAHAAAPAPAAVKPAAKAPVSGGTKINAPMPGTVLDIRTSEGASVKRGDVLLILEAMKMENEIMCPADGVVKQIAVGKGASVNSGDVLIVIG